MTQRLAELHLHFQQCIPPDVLLEHLARAENIDWEWYESSYKAAYGVDSPARQLAERYRNGDKNVLREFRRVCIFGDNDAGNIMRFLAKSNLFWAGSYRNDTPDDNQQELLAFASNIKNEFVKQGITYAEFRQSTEPALLKMFDTDKSEITMRLAVSLERSNPWSQWEQVKEMALGEYGRALTAVDFCKIEEGYPPKNMVSFFNAVKEFNQQHPDRALAILYHVGESFNDKSLQSAIRWVQEAAEMGAHRLGHAIALGIDPTMYGEHTRQESVGERRDQIAYDLNHQAGLLESGVDIDEGKLRIELQELSQLAADATAEVSYDKAALEQIRLRQGYAIKCILATNAVVEVCPTSNLRVAGMINPTYHPIHRFVAEGLLIVVSTDDPGIFDITLEHELNWVVENVKDAPGLRETLLTNAYQSRSEVLSGRER